MRCSISIDKGDLEMLVLSSSALPQPAQVTPPPSEDRLFHLIKELLSSEDVRGSWASKKVEILQGFNTLPDGQKVRSSLYNLFSSLILKECLSEGLELTNSLSSQDIKEATLSFTPKLLIEQGWVEEAFEKFKLLTEETYKHGALEEMAKALLAKGLEKEAKRYAELLDNFQDRAAFLLLMAKDLIVSNKIDLAMDLLHPVWWEKDWVSYVEHLLYQVAYKLSQSPQFELATFPIHTLVDPHLKDQARSNYALALFWRNKLEEAFAEAQCIKDPEIKDETLDTFCESILESLTLTKDNLLFVTRVVLSFSSPSKMKEPFDKILRIALQCGPLDLAGKIVARAPESLRPGLAQTIIHYNIYIASRHLREAEWAAQLLSKGPRSDRTKASLSEVLSLLQN